MTRVLWIGLGVLSLAGCSRRGPVPPPPPTPVARTAPAAAVDAGAVAPPRPRYEALGRRPPNPRRAEPPPEIAGRALAVGATAPEVRLASSAGPLSLREALSKQDRVVLVFYRGDW